MWRNIIYSLLMPKLVPKNGSSLPNSFSFLYLFTTLGKPLGPLGLNKLTKLHLHFLKIKTASQRRLHSFQYYSFPRGISLILLPSKFCACLTARDQCAFSTKSNCHLLDIAVTLPPSARGEKAKEYDTVHRKTWSQRSKL